MKNFTVRAIFKILMTGTTTDEYDEQIWLLSGENEGDVYNQAMVYGIREDEIFYNLKGHKIHWKFLGITEINRIIQEEISIISSRTVHTEPNSLFEQSILQRSQKLSEIYTQPIKFREFDH